MRSFHVILAFAILLCAGVSCAKEELKPKVETVPEGHITVFVKARHEAGIDSKASLNTFNGYVGWESSDKLKAVYEGGSAVSSEASMGEANSASFAITYPEEKTLTHVVYPHGIAATNDGGDFKVTVPASQDGSFAGAAIEVAQYGESLALKNLGGMLQIVIGDDGVRTIRISSNDETPLAGTAVVSFSAGLPVIGALSGTSTSVSLSVSGAGTYYAAVLPCSLEAGLFVELLDESHNVIGEKYSGNTLSVERRQIRKLGTIGATTLNKYFFKPGGTGDGLSWDTAGGITLMDAVLSGGSDATLFLAQGEYHIGEIDGIDGRSSTAQCIRATGNTFKIYGGYPASATGTSISGRNTSVPTVITGDGTYRILVLNYLKTQFTADGITFTKAYRTGSDVGSALILSALATASFNKCVISDNVKEGSGGGGAIRVTQGEVSFTDCSFSGNTVAGNGGVMAITGGSVSLQKCRFTLNSAGENGGAVYITDGTLDCTDCEFTENSAKESGKRGSAIFSNGSSIVRMNACYFAENKASGGGTIWSDSATGRLFLNACSFYKNTTATYASVIGSRGICGVNNCAFQQNSNTSTTGASNFYTVNGNTVITNSSFRLAANAAVGIWAAGGTTFLANNTLVNSTASAESDKGVALKSSAPLISYGHNLVSKFYEVTADTYSIQDAGEADVLDYSLSQNWHSTKHCIYWSKWNDAGVKPAGFEFSTPCRVEEGLDAFEAASGAGFKTWLQSLRIEGYNALQTDILGRKRGINFIWPGDYENTAYAIAPTEAGILQEFVKSGTIVRGSCADPCIVYSHGEFFLTMTGSTRLAMIHDSDLSHLTAAAHSVNDNIIYDSASDPTVATMYEGVELDGTWSPEVHYFSEEDCPGNSGWYMVFAVKKKGTSIIRSVVLKASGTAKPTGPWRNPVTGEENCTQRFLDAAGKPVMIWAIGISYLRIPTGRYKGIYAMWVDETGRGEGYGNFYQRLRIARLAKPWQIASEAAIITTPTQAWERVGADDTKPMVVEGGTAVYGDHGEIFLTYCGSGYWSDYGQGQLTLKRENGDYADPLQTESWIKYEGNPVLSSNLSSDLRGAGHSFFFKDDAGNRFMCYHAYPYSGGVKGSNRNAYVEPYYIDYNDISPTAPQGVLHFGALDNGVTAPTSSTNFSYFLKK